MKVSVKKIQNDEFNAIYKIKEQNIFKQLLVDFSKIEIVFCVKNFFVFQMFYCKN
jgi:hypothetical protein